MKWLSALSERHVLEQAIHESCRSFKSTIDANGRPDLTFLFVSPHFYQTYARAGAMVQQTLQPRQLIGCSAAGVIGAGREVENTHGISLFCAWLPRVDIKSFHVTDSNLPDSDASPKSWHKLLGVPPEKKPHFVLLVDPFSDQIDSFLAGLDFAYPQASKVGGLASGTRARGGNALYLNRHIHRKGVVGIALSGDIVLDTLVSQGCRPIGRPMTVTTCEDDILLGLDGSPPLKVLEELYEKLPPRDRELLRTSLFLGVVMDARKESIEKGDFLIRNITGADMDKGILAVGANLRPGQTVQFHLRDAKTSAEDLHHILTTNQDKLSGNNNKAALLFSCLGRGKHFYGRTNHDSEMFQKNVGQVPMGGFFCNGEIGPVSGTTYLHGYTSCFGIFRTQSSAMKT